MSSKKRTSPNRLLATTAVAAIAAGMLFTGLPQNTMNALAEPVSIQAPQMPGFADVVEAVSPAVVSVRVSSDAVPVSNEGFSFNFNGEGFDSLPDDHPLKRFFDQFEHQFGDRDRPHADRGEREHRRRVRPVSQGSGFFITDDGYIVTNNHVVEGGTSFSVILNDSTELDAKLIGRDPRTDLAVLKVDADRTFTYVDFAPDNSVRVGDWVVAVGNPFGLGGSVTAGIVSARGRDIGANLYDDFIQVDAAVNKGNSGGPTFNLSGQVIGINTAIYSPSGGNVGIAFAIPASTAKSVVSELMEDGSVERGWLGVRIQNVTEDIAESLGLDESRGSLVIEPQSDAPADTAGIEAGDVITAVNGNPVEDSRDLAKKIAKIDPGESVEITIWRDGKSEAKTVELGTFPKELASAPASRDEPGQSAPASETLDKFGLTVVPAEDTKGLVITDVSSDSIAMERGLRVGDVIVAVNNEEVKSADDVVDIISAAAADGRKAALFQVENQERSRFVALPIEQG